MILIALAVLLLLCRLLSLPQGPAAWLQETCRLSLGEPRAELYEALLCGVRLGPGENQAWFKAWGLIHLLVVSGAHFLFLERHLDRMTPPRLSLKLIFNLPLLVIYGFATGLGPPVLRAGLALILIKASNHLHFQWTHAQVVLLAGALSLLALPSEGHLSLQLSWAAALLISWPLKPSPLQIRRMAVLWLGLLPLLAGFGWTSPLSILANVIMVPLFQVLVFPAIWIDQALHLGLKSAELGDFFEKALHALPSSIQTLAPDEQWKWLYLLALQTLALFQRRDWNADHFRFHHLYYSGTR